MSASLTHAQAYTFLKWGTGPSPAEWNFNNPFVIAVDSSCDVYVADTTAPNCRIEKFDRNGNFITQWSPLGSANRLFSAPYGVAVDFLGNVYVVDTTNERVQKFDSNGNYITQWGAGGSADGLFNGPHGVLL